MALRFYPCKNLNIYEHTGENESLSKNPCWIEHLLLFVINFPSSNRSANLSAYEVGMFSCSQRDFSKSHNSPSFKVQLTSLKFKRFIITINYLFVKYSKSCYGKMSCCWCKRMIWKHPNFTPIDGRKQIRIQLDSSLTMIKMWRNSFQLNLGK